MPTHAELSARRRQLSRTWERVLADSKSLAAMPSSPLDGRLLESWRRSAAWVSPNLAAAPVDNADVAIEQWRSTPVAAGVRTAEDDLRRVADDGDLIAAVTDRSGRIVWTYGSRVMRRAADRVNFVPGGRWDEASVGTNALALALRTGAPSTVYSAEHFSRAVHGWVCYSVPLADPRTADVLGVLDLSTTWDRAHPLAMRTAQLLGRLVTSAMPQQRAAAEAPMLELRVLGGWRVRLDRSPLVLPRRQVEILVLLALHPAGLSLEALHARLYGDAPVSTATLKAEVSHLRSALDGRIGSRPYRLMMPVDSDVARVLASLDRGEVSRAVAAYAGPLLPESESPDVAEWREYVEVALRSAVLATRDVETVLRVADTHPYDQQLQEHLARILAPDDPRAAATAARVNRARPE